MSVDYTSAIRLSAEDRAFHWQEGVRLRALAMTITTEPIRARVLAQALEHARLIGLTNEDERSAKPVFSINMP
jgi:hypothetical protein